MPHTLTLSISINDLADKLNTSTLKLASKFIKVICEKNIDVSTNIWLALATVYSSAVNSESQTNAIQRLLSGISAGQIEATECKHLRVRLDTNINENEICADFLWLQLGSIDIEQRWRAAHSVRLLAKFDKWDVIQTLFDKYEYVNVGAFQGPSKKFINLNAQLWFLIAIARIAMDFPEKIHSYKSKLESIITNDTIPHVGIHSAAIEALINIHIETTGLNSEKILNRLGEANTSEQIISKVKAHLNTIEVIYSINDEYKEDPSFRANETFADKIKELAEIFNSNEKDLNDQCKTWIQKWNPEFHPDEEYGKLANNNENDYFYQLKNNQSNANNFNLLWHVLAIVSGLLFKTTPQPETSDFETKWANWVSNFCITCPHKFWIADATQTIPLIAFNELQEHIDYDVKIGDSNQNPLPISCYKKNSLYESFVPEIKHNNELIIRGKWTTPDHVEVNITSALVETEKANNAILAIASMPVSSMKLPYYESLADENSKRHNLEMRPFKAWTTAVDRNNKLDYHDPRGFVAFYFRPSKSIINNLNLKSKNPISHEWQDNSGKIAFQYSCWGSFTKQGAITSAGYGHLLKCNTESLIDVLSDKYNLVILTKLKYPDFIEHSFDDAYFHNENSYAVQLVTLDIDLKFKTFIPTKKQLD